MITTASDNEIYFAKIRESAIIPTKKFEDAGYDMYANFEEDYFLIKQGATRPVPTGIAVAFSPKFYAQVEERGSTGKMGLKKSGGVFDSGYRGEYLILLYNATGKPVVISKVEEQNIPETITVDGEVLKKGEFNVYPYSKAICQIVLQTVPDLASKEISYDELKAIASERGSGRFGGSGK